MEMVYYSRMVNKVELEMEYPNQISLKIQDPAVDLLNCSDEVTQNFLDDAYYYSRIVNLEQIEPGTNRYRCTETDIDESYLNLEYLLVDDKIYTEYCIRNRAEFEAMDFFEPIGEIVGTTHV